jgi:transposase
MADHKPQPECPHCAELNTRVGELTTRIAELEAALAKAKKNSGNSSKPPSGDIVNPPKKHEKPGRPKKRKRGGQPGHDRHLRTPFEEDELDGHWIWHYGECPCCGGQLVDDDKPAVVLQQVELLALPLEINQHDRHHQRCTSCQKSFLPELPEDLRKAGLIGPRLTALVGYLKGPCHMSYSAIRRYFRDVIGVRISRGMLGKLVQKVSAALEDPYDALLTMLQVESRLNVDETGHKNNGKRMWTWCFRAYLYTVYKISPSRGSQVLIDVLGEEFNGVLGCDYFSAYRKYMKDFDVSVQFCLAHLIRDVKFLVEHPDKKNQEYGERLRKDLRRLFGVIHRREQYASDATFQRALEHARDELVWDATMESPQTRESENMADRFYKHTESYFRFITEPNVEPTNNLAEQAIRFVAIHRRITQGTRSEDGQRWCERIWTVVQTCGQQGRSAFEFMCAAVTAHFCSEPAPSLAPDSS